MFKQLRKIAVSLICISLFPAVISLGAASTAHAESVSQTINVNSGNSRGVAISPDGLFAYVTSELDGTLTKVDLSTNSVVSTFTVGSEPYSVAITPNGTYALVTNSGGNSVSKINLSTNEVVNIALGTFAMDVSIDPTGAFAYVTEFYANKVSKINLSTNTVVARLSVGGGPREIAITPSGDFAYTANDGSGTATKIDLSAFTAVATIETGINPYGLTIDSSGEFAYVLNLNSSDISKISVSSNEVVGTLSISSPWAMALVPGTPFAFVTSHSSALITKINLNSFTSIGTTAVGNYPRGLAVNSSTSKLYVTNYSTGRLKVVNILLEAQSIAMEIGSSFLLGAGTVALSATASSALTVSFSSSTTDVCTVAGTTVTLLSYGTCTVNANQTGGSGWLAAPMISRSFTVSRQVITFNSLSSAALGAGTRSVSATASSGLTVAFSSATTDICTVSGTTVTLLAYGTCTVKANQTGSNGDVALEVQRSFTVTRQIITFDSLPNALLGAGTVSVSATAPSGLPVLFSTSATGVCTVSGTTVTLNDLGQCTIIANQTSGNGDIALPVSQSFSVLPMPAHGGVIGEISGGEDGVAITPNGGNAYVPSAPRSLVRVGVVSRNRTVSTLPKASVRDVAIDISGSYAYVTHPDLDTVTKVRLSDNSVISEIAVPQYPNHIVMGASGNYAYIDAISRLIRIRLSDNAVDSLHGFSYLTDVAVDPSEQFAYVSDWNAMAVKKVNLSTMQVDAQINGVGQVKGLAIDPAGEFAYVAVHSLGVIKKIRLSTFTVVGSISVGQNPWDVAISSDGLWAFVTNNGAATISKVSLTKAVAVGSISVGAGPKGVSISPDGQRIFVVNSTDQTTSVILNENEIQTISFTSLSDVLLGAGSVSLSATSSSTQEVTFSSVTTDVCTVAGSTVTLVAYGTCTVNANQAGGSGWAAAPVMSRSFTVARQVITFGSLSDVLLGAGSFSVSATASSGLAVVFSSATSDVCTVTGSTVTLLAYGTCTVKANQAGSNGDAALEVQQSFAVARQVIAFSSLADVFLGVGSVSVSATASSGLAVVFSSATSDVCTVTGSTVTLLSYGTCTVKANQTGSNGDVALEVQRSFAVTRQVITFGSLPDILLSLGTTSVSASASSGLAVVFSSATPDVCTVAGASVTLVKSGDCTIAADQTGLNGDKAISVSQTFFVIPMPPAGETGVSINSGSSYTNAKQVLVNVVWPSGATKARISNDGAFDGAKTKVMSLTPQIQWELDDSVKGVFTKIIYVRFSGSGIDTSKTYSDDIILDTTAPTIEAASVEVNSGNLSVSLKAKDDISGVDDVQFNNGDKTITENYSESLRISQVSFDLDVASAGVKKQGTSSIRFRVSDVAGNWTSWRSVAIVPKATSAPLVTGLVLSLSKSATAKSVASLAKIPVASTSKITMSVAKTSTKFCKISGALVKGLAVGSCKITVTVTPKKGAKTSRTVILKVSK